MLKVIAQDFIKPEWVDTVIPLYKELVEKTRQERDCIAYDLFVDQNEPGHFIFIEELISSNLSARHVLSVYCEIGKINFIKFVSETLRYIMNIIEFENTVISFYK